MVFTLALRHTYVLWQRAMSLVQFFVVRTSLASFRAVSEKPSVVRPSLASANGRIALARSSRMTAVNLNAWLDCNNEMDMDSFIQQFDNDRALRAFAILNAKSVLEHLVDERSTSAITVAESYLAGGATIDELSNAYDLAGAAIDDLEAAHMSGDDHPDVVTVELEDSRSQLFQPSILADWMAHPEFRMLK